MDLLQGLVTLLISAALSKKTKPTVQQTGFNIVRNMLLHLQVPRHRTGSAFKKVVPFNTFSLSDSVNQLFCYLTIQTN